jgi:hypothetical protein
MAPLKSALPLLALQVALQIDAETEFLATVQDSLAKSRD